MRGGRWGLSRRRFLQTTATTVLASQLLGTASAQQTDAPEPDYGGWFSNVDNYDGETLDRRGESEVTVLVGTEGNGGPAAFDPPAVHVDLGATVVFEWTGEGGWHHNVVAEDGNWRSGEPTSEAGATFERTFEEEGIVRYDCGPHRALGMKGAVVVGGNYESVGGTDEPRGPRPAYGDWFANTDNYDGDTVDRRDESAVTVTVGAQGNHGPNAFDPPAIHVDRGTTVMFEWTGDGAHNVVQEGEEGVAEWESGDPVGEAGIHFERQFHEPGIQRYFCDPHISLGMRGAIVVGDDVETVGGDGGEAAGEDGETTDDGGARSADEGEEPTPTTDDTAASGPGFGVASALAGIGGTSYLWNLRAGRDETGDR